MEKSISNMNTFVLILSIVKLKLNQTLFRNNLQRKNIPNLHLTKIIVGVIRMVHFSVMKKKVDNSQHQTRKRNLLPVKELIHGMNS